MVYDLDDHTIQAARNRLLGKSVECHRTNTIIRTVNTVVWEFHVSCLNNTRINDHCLQSLNDMRQQGVRVSVCWQCLCVHVWAHVYVFIVPECRCVWACVWPFQLLVLSQKSWFLLLTSYLPIKAFLTPTPHILSLSSSQLLKVSSKCN